MDSRIDSITQAIEDYAGDSWTDGYHIGFEEGFDEAVDKSEELIDEAYSDGFDKANAQSTLTVSYKGRCSDSYKFTTSDRYDPAIAELKAAVSAKNKSLRDMFARYSSPTGIAKFAPYLCKYSDKWVQPHAIPEYYRLSRVRLMPRGSRVAAVEAEGSRYRRKYDSYLPMKYATSFDVYVGRA